MPNKGKHKVIEGSFDAQGFTEHSKSSLGGPDTLQAHVYFTSSAAIKNLYVHAFIFHTQTENAALTTDFCLIECINYSYYKK